MNKIAVALCMTIVSTVADPHVVTMKKVTDLKQAITPVQHIINNDHAKKFIKAHEQRDPAFRKFAVQVLPGYDHESELTVEDALSIVNFTNFGNMAYTGPIYFGTPVQTTMESVATFVYDTGSSWLVTGTT